MEREFTFCKDCLCWMIAERLRAKSDQLRECRRNPPYVVAATSIMAYWPVTLAEWGCWSGIKRALEIPGPQYDEKVHYSNEAGERAAPSGRPKGKTMERRAKKGGKR